MIVFSYNKIIEFFVSMAVLIRNMKIILYFLRLLIFFTFYYVYVFIYLILLCII